MRYFKKLVEIAQKNFDSKSATSLKIINAIEENEVFVFRPTNKEQSHLDEDVNYFTHGIDAPFKVFSMEFVGEHKISTMGNDETHSDFGDVQILCMMAVENKPNNFTFYLLTKAIRGLVESYEVISTEHLGKEGLYHWCLHLMAEMLEKIKKQKIGIESVREKMKLGTGKHKRYHKIKRVIHVVPKREVDKAESSTGREIDWSHRWSVRGHWRDCKGIGKDRDENYCVEGKTWVVAHEKGAESGEAIKKQRLVLND